LHAVLKFGGSGVLSPISKELKLALEVSLVTGISCDGLEEKKAEVFEGVIAKNHGKVGASQWGKKGLREVSNLHTTMNYEGGSVFRDRERARANRSCYEA
jgi:hypothetical protein